MRGQRGVLQISNREIDKEKTSTEENILAQTRGRGSRGALGFPVRVTRGNARATGAATRAGAPASDDWMVNPRCDPKPRGPGAIGSRPPR